MEEGLLVSGDRPGSRGGCPACHHPHLQQASHLSVVCHLPANMAVAFSPLFQVILTIFEVGTTLALTDEENEACQ